MNSIGIAIQAYWPKCQTKQYLHICVRWTMTTATNHLKMINILKGLRIFFPTNNSNFEFIFSIWMCEILISTQLLKISFCKFLSSFVYLFQNYFANTVFLSWYLWINAWKLECLRVSSVIDLITDACHTRQGLHVSTCLACM